MGFFCCFLFFCFFFVLFFKKVIIPFMLSHTTVPKTLTKCWVLQERWVCLWMLVHYYPLVSEYQKAGSPAVGTAALEVQAYVFMKVMLFISQTWQYCYVYNDSNVN